jgi:predicted lipoprotein
MKKSLLLLLLAFAIASCTEDQEANEVTDGQRESMLRALAENVINPGFTVLHTRSGVLHTAIEEFVNAPGQSTLDAAQAAWIDLGKTWKRIEFYQQGLLDQEGQDSLIHKLDLGAVDPIWRVALVPKAQLELAIANVQGSESTYVSHMPANLQGIPAIEALLFGGTDAEVIAQFDSSPQGLNRKLYLLGLRTLLEDHLLRVQESWKPASGTAFDKFVHGSGTDLNSSLGMLMNDMVSLAESMKNQKIGRPLGYLSAQVPQPDSVEARLSKQSLAFFIENLNGIEQAFTADGDGRTGMGIDSLLNFMDAKVGDKNLSEAVKTQLATMRTLAQSLGDDLPNAIRTNKLKVEELFTECLVLVKLLKVDVVTTLGVMITTLEGDGD